MRSSLLPVSRLPSLAGLLLVAACVETADAPNDENSFLPVYEEADGGGAGGGFGGAGGGTGGGTGGSSADAAVCVPSGTGGGTTGGGTVDAGSTGGGFLGGILGGLFGGGGGGMPGGSVAMDAGEPLDAGSSDSPAPCVPAPGGTGGGVGGSSPGSFAGRANGCSSYGLPMAPAKCAGYYCNISQSELESVLPNPGGKCGNFSAERVCGGALTRSVGSCSRSVKSANPLDSDEQIRAKVQECVKKEPQYSDVSDDCLGCFLDAAQCASDNCLFQCLSGDSSGCDSCRMMNGCNQQVPKCAGLPDPF